MLSLMYINTIIIYYYGLQNVLYTLQNYTIMWSSHVSLVKGASNVQVVYKK
jgi:hypothetical protein